jgi:hypothetical protein
MLTKLEADEARRLVQTYARVLLPSFGSIEIENTVDQDEWLTELAWKRPSKEECADRPGEGDFHFGLRTWDVLINIYCPFQTPGR